MNCYDALLLCHNLVFSLSCCTEHFCDSATAVHWSLSLTKLSVESCVSRTAARAALSLSFARLGRSVECTTGGELHSNEDVSSGWSRVLLSAAAQLCLEKFQLKCPRNSFEKEIEILFFYGSSPDTRNFNARLMRLRTISHTVQSTVVADSEYQLRLFDWISLCLLKALPIFSASH